MFFRCSSRIPPWPWTIGLGRPGRARAVEHPQRVVERDLLEGQRLVVGRRAPPASRCRRGSRSARPARRSRSAMPRDDLAAVVVAPAVAVAVDREQHLGLDLREAVDDRARAELGRRARPHRADRGGGQEGRDRLGDVGHVGGDAVARADAQCAAGRRRCARSARAARPTSTATARAARWRGGWPPRRRRARGRSARRRTAATPGTTRAPGISRRPSTRSYGSEACTSKNSQIARPEALEVVDRPAPQRVVVALAPDGAREAGDRRALGALGGRAPQQLGLHGR